MHKGTVFCITALLFTIALARTNEVRADVAPPEPPSGTNPMPGEELTNVRMAAETVLIDIGRDGPYGEGLGKVTATFTMHNLGEVDEQMEVRFPLDQTLGWGTLCKNPFPQFWPIEDLSVKVNGRSVAAQKTYETITLMTMEEPHPTVTLPCWEHFPVSFPAGKDVVIQVTYTTEPYHAANAAYVYAYVLETGKGWKGTIGTADIIFQAPYELNDRNFYSCRPADCTLNGSRVQWHYDDFEPTANVSVSLLPPPLWQAIAVEKVKVSRNPNDGEAWGRLGKAYKEAILEMMGLRSDPAGTEMYRLSVEAYQHAVTLLSGDADWHYGFAELLCRKADDNSLMGESAEDDWRACVEQIRQTIHIDPEHEKANELLQQVAELGMVDISGPQPDYLILTPQPTTLASPDNSQVPTPVETITEPAGTSEIIQATKITENAPVKTGTPTIPTATTPLPGKSNVPLYLGVSILILILVFGVRKRRQG